MGQYLDEWLPGVRKGGPSLDVWHVRTRRTPTQADHRRRPVAGPDVPAGEDRLRSAGRGRRHEGRPLSPKTVHNVHLCLRRALRDAVRARLIAFNPAEAAHRLPADSRPEMQAWTSGELRTFLAATAEHPLRALYRVAAQTGLCRGELLGLRWRDVLFSERRLSVGQQLSRQGELIRLGPVKTKAGRRSVSLDQVTVAALLAHREAQRALAAQLGRSAPTGADLVFARPDGSRHDPDVISQTFERLVAKAGLRRIRFHDLRHTHATLALQAGVHAKVVQERLGHSSINVTIDLYSHAIPALQEDAADRIAALVDAAELATEGGEEPR